MGGHVGQGGQAVGVQVLVPHLQHVVLDCSAGNKDVCGTCFMSTYGGKKRPWRGSVIEMPILKCFWTPK